MKVGSRVMVDAIDGFGGTAFVVEDRGGSGCRFKVRMDEGVQEDFWAHAEELSEIEPPRAGYDSRPDTIAHIKEVRRLLAKMIADLECRSDDHDQSKLHSPEAEVFDAMTPRLKQSTYGSEEYKGFLAQMRPALDHHYANNSHHPEHFADGIRGMSLLDLLEMLVDWKAATLRHADGDIRRSIEINQKRFGYSDELKAILLNTLAVVEG